MSCMRIEESVECATVPAVISASEMARLLSDNGRDNGGSLHLFCRNEVACDCQSRLGTRPCSAVSTGAIPVVVPELVAGHRQANSKL